MSLTSPPVPRSLSHPEDLHHLIAQVVDQPTAMRPAFGLSKAREVSLCSVAQASSGETVILPFARASAARYEASGCMMATTFRPSMPAKSAGLHV